ncbi:hypothetical protein CL656_05365 [bacterium]|nr:hypothetical protein [bacterium]|tara:strand:- start:6628 stop:7533 length:906 start_codon:yes stop_codon:yes gene_type:complete
MNSIKSKYVYVLKSIKKDKSISPNLLSLSGKTFIITGSSNGIGLNIAKKLLENGANITITDKKTNEDKNLDSSIYVALNELNKIRFSKKTLAVPCDICKPNEIDNVINETLNKFGKLDGVILNSTALFLKNTLKQTDKETDIMNRVNINGTYYFGQRCLRKMRNNHSGHILVISPPIYMLYDDDWWTNHMYYSMSKFNMSLMAKFWNKEFHNIAVNTLWPRTTISTTPIQNIIGGEELIKISRTTDIMGDAAAHILASDSYGCNGKNFIDDEVLSSLDLDLEKYKINTNIDDRDLMPDFFC